MKDKNEVIGEIVCLERYEFVDMRLIAKIVADVYRINEEKKEIKEMRQKNLFGDAIKNLRA